MKIVLSCVFLLALAPATNLVVKAADFPDFEVRDDACTSNDLCGTCEGPCSNDSECEEGLKCLVESSYEFSGCMGTATDGVGYCWDHSVLMSTLPQANDGDKMFGTNRICTGPGGLCMECEGDCDSSEDCGEGLECMSRNLGEPVPGCYGEAQIDVDYCYVPDPENPIEPAADTVFEKVNGSDVEFGDCTGANSCGLCEGDCDRNRECEDGLVCYHRNEGAGKFQNKI